MRCMIDMSRKEPMGLIDWEFIYEMQGIAPEWITADMIRLTPKFLAAIPAKWQKIKSELASHVQKTGVAYIAICDVENEGSDFKITGTLQQQGQPLAFRKVVVYDRDRFEDDYLGTVITDAGGCFVLTFSKKAFSDFGLEAMPDIYFRIHTWVDTEFGPAVEIEPKPYKISHFTDKKVLMEFGAVEVPAE